MSSKPRWWPFGKKAAPKSTRSFVVPITAYSARRGTAQVLRAYKEDAWLHAIVDTVANGVANPTWRAFKRVGKDGKAVRDYSLQNAPHLERTKVLKRLENRSELIEIPNHEILRILNNPNAQFTGRACFKVMQIHLDLVGEAFMWIQRDQSGRPTGYIPLPPHSITQTPTEASPFFAVLYNSLSLNIPVSDLIWLRSLDPENPHGRGTGLGLALGDELDSSEYIAQTLKSTFARGGIPAAVVSIESKETDAAEPEQAVEDLQKRYEESFRGPQNAGKVWFAPGRVSMAALNINFKELQLNEIDQSIRDYIRHCFNVSPELMGDLTASNRATSEEAKYTLAEYALLPRLEFWRTELQHKLVPLIDSDVILEFDDPRPQSWERKFSIMTTMPVEGFTWNEYREFAGFEPLAELEGKRPLPQPGQADLASSDAPKNGPDAEKAFVPQPLFRNVLK